MSEMLRNEWNDTWDDTWVVREPEPVESDADDLPPKPITDLPKPPLEKDWS
jgi:hypothetical protein